MKPPPRHEDYEKNLLGCCLRNPGLVDKHGIVASLLYEERDRIILNTIIEMKSKNLLIGGLEVWQYLKEKGLRERLNHLCPGGMAFVYIGNLVDQSIMGNAKNEVKKLREYEQLRKVLKKSHKVIQAIEEGKGLDEIEKMKVEL